MGNSNVDARHFLGHFLALLRPLDNFGKQRNSERVLWCADWLKGLGREVSHAPYTKNKDKIHVPAFTKRTGLNEEPEIIAYRHTNRSEVSPIRMTSPDSKYLESCTTVSLTNTGLTFPPSNTVNF